MGDKEQKPIQVLKERRGGTSPEVKERIRRHRKLRKAIRAALAGGPRTVPELSGELELPSHDVLWMLMAMKKYGEIEEGEERESYHEYSLHEEEAAK
jgi:hypothetical protein